MEENSEVDSKLKELTPEPLFEILYEILHKLLPNSYPQIQN
jgi:hypothetical protein